MPKAGRNDACPCGSGKKYKKCCEAKAAQSRNSTMMLIVAGAILLMIVVGLALRDRDRGPGDGRVWSAEHGHYHAP
jgi:hypothetical protein